MTAWLVEGLIPAGATVAAAADLDDDVAAMLAAGVDVVLRLHDRCDELFDAGAPMLLEVVWRPGLVSGCSPPAPFLVRFNPAAGGFERCEAA